MPDAELLRRFLANDESAFAELVRRHGRLVWAVCRHLTRSDAEADDAFQATFLVLLKNAKKVRDAGRLSAWLHGVAYKVCAKARRASQRRHVRERAVAAREGNGSAVPDSAWDRALAAVHEEVAKLPDTLRVPFVLCCLEGIGVTEAAEQLGWKLGTLSGRLTRAKDAVLLKLEARGMTLGIVATVGVVTVPTAVTAKAAALAQVGFAVPVSILQLSQGVIGMSMKSVKVLAAVVMLTCGVSLSVGTGWVTNAEAQQSSDGGFSGAPSKADPEAEVKRLMANLEKAEQAARQELRLHLKATRPFEKSDLRIPAFKTSWWEYDLVDMDATFDKAKFGFFLLEREVKGWEFLGSTTLGKSGGVFQWLFRRPVKGAPVEPVNGVLRMSRLGEETIVRLWNAPKAEDAKDIEAEIARLSKKLAELKTTPLRLVATFSKDMLPLEPADFAALLSKLAEKKFGKWKASVSHSAQGIEVRGDKDVGEWAIGLVKALSGK